MRGLEAAKARVESAMENLFETVEEDLSWDLYTKEHADTAIRELGGGAEDAWADWVTSSEEEKE